MHKSNSGTLTERMIKNNLKETFARFVSSDNAFSFMSLVKGRPTY